jgi:Mg2+-importing ATPase
MNGIINKRFAHTGRAAFFRYVSLILIMVLLSGVLDFYQEHKAEKAAQVLKEKVTTTATIIRDGANRK